MDSWLQLALTAVFSVLASSGFWAYVQHKDVEKKASTRLMMGLAYAELTTLGHEHIRRGYITQDAYEDFCNYFYIPYKELGGNGVAERVMSEVSKLPLRGRTNEEYTNNVVRIVPRVEQEAPAE